jgi:hypothetical protein
VSRPFAAILYIVFLVCLGLGFYEITAKSASWLGVNLPGGTAARFAERTTRWDPPTGIHPVDKLLHEGEEAIRFYRHL